MRSMALALTVFLVWSAVAQGYPFFGGNGEVNLTVFGAFKRPLPPYINQEDVILNVDVVLLQANSTALNPVLAQFGLVDGNDRVYPSIKGWGSDLQLGRKLLGFVVPKEAVIKSLQVYPDLGSPFSINWPEVPEVGNGEVELRCYGIVDQSVDYGHQSVTLDVGMTNNGTSNLIVGPKNFTLFDQWGWPYESDEAMVPRVLGRNESMRPWLTFGPLSPLSKPSLLVYHSSNLTDMVVGIDYGLWEAIASSPCAISPSRTSPCGCGGSSGGTKEVIDPNSTKGKIAAAKERLAKVKG
jgi:hypothetical protein